MTDPIKRIETTHIDEVTRTATSSVQWFLENRNLKGKATHPITHNNQLKVFVCGKDAFDDITVELGRAKKSIHICCWGFDPGMELVRNQGETWPRGVTYGDLLIAAGRRGVRVRLLIWFNLASTLVPSQNPRNMPGITHGRLPWRRDGGSAAAAPNLSAENSLAALKAHCAKQGSATSVWKPYPSARSPSNPITTSDIPLLAREEYCFSWYQAAFHGRLANIDICTHTGDARSIAESLSTESFDSSTMEGIGLEYSGTHHQKPILIDFDYNDGSKAIGYVMGLNSVTDYWDTANHILDDPLREQGGHNERKEDAKGFRSRRPYRDYACRIDGGASLIALHNNFANAWNRAFRDDSMYVEPITGSGKIGDKTAPAELLRKARPSDSSVQIVRTQPAEDDKTIKELYLQATDNAALGLGYLYVENQYFQSEAWSQRLMATRKSVMQHWNKGRVKPGKSMEEMPTLHVFIVIPVPERAQMIPRTYDALATLGQQDAMAGQVKLIKRENEAAKNQETLDRQGIFRDELGQRVEHRGQSEVVRHANGIVKPEPNVLEKTYGMKVCTAMLNSCGSDGYAWRYREIYIHSKLLLIDDNFFTLGSANLNERSFAADSELNMATNDPALAQELRQRIWSGLSGGKISGGGGSRREIEQAFNLWSDLLRDNGKSKDAGMKMHGFLLPLHDERSSTTRLG
jgi:phosphatidylserine/phosphatidylglycerophosphate/cardiolipin synthase-like enzyme